jgi:hypothetical protein
VVKDLPEEKSYHFTFTGFSRHPRAVHDKPTIWDSTALYEAPWAELSTKTLILTVPTENLREVNSIPELSEFLDRAVKLLAISMSYTPIRPYRVVFDIDILDNQVGYPVFLSLDHVSDILLQISEPTQAMFQMLQSLAIVSMREGCFDTVTETAIAYLVTILVLKGVFPAFDPTNSPACPEAPLLYRELWLIHSQINPFALLQLLKDAQKPEAEVHSLPEDMWISFVQDLSYKAKFNLSGILGKVRPIPMNLTNLLKELSNPFVTL